MIKIIALTTMLIDHLGQIFFPHVPILNIIGRLAFPLYAWGVAKGYKYTRNFILYSLRLLLLSIVSQVPYYYLFGPAYGLNVCFTLLSGLTSIWIYENFRPICLRWPVIAGLLIFSQVLNFNYGMYGVLTVLMFKIFSGKDILILVQAALTFVSVVVFSMEPVQLVAALSPLLLLFIENKDFRINKIIQYGFYPCHMVLLIIMRNLFY